jgi:hypothetical protein
VISEGARWRMSNRDEFPESIKKAVAAPEIVGIAIENP